jgi:hypothetical protein
MPPRETTSPGASPVSQLIPDLPRIGPDLLEVPGMLEHDQRMQKWWDAFKRSSIGTQLEQGKTLRKVEATYTAGLTVLEARITTEETVRASADSALASRATALEASIDTPTTGLLARVAVIESAYVDASGAYAQAISAISAELTGPGGDIYAAILVESNARSSADSALASRATTLEAQVQTPTTGLLARVSVIESAYVDASGAYAQANSAISAALGGGGSITSAISASVSSEASARATADGYFASMYTLTAVAPGVIGGMKITAVSNPSGWTSYSEVSFQADRFTIYSGTSGLPPFQIVGGKVRFTSNVEIDGSLLVAGTLTLSQVSGAGSLAAKNSVDLATGDVTNKSLANVDSSANTKLAGIAAGADVTLSELNGGLSITGGGITLDAGGAIKGGALNFSTGTGFFLGYEGGQYKFRVGDPSGARIAWDGSSWTVVSFAASAPNKTVTLTNSTGNPLYDPTGGGTHALGSIISISAQTIGGYTFSKWSGSALDEACVESLFSQTTNLAVNHDISLIADYV